MATAVQLQPHLDDLSVRDLYASECEKIGCRKNSELLKKVCARVVSTDRVVCVPPAPKGFLFCHSSATLFLSTQLPDTPGDFTSLRELDLSLNCVGKKGVRALLWVMRCATNLEKVLLADNFLTNDSIAEIVAVLNEHPAVAHVDVSRNPISHDAGKLLSEFVGTHPIITGVGVRDTLINPALVRIIEKKAAHNNALASGGVPAAAAAATAAEGGGIAAPPAAAVEAKAAAPYADAASVPETVAEAEAPALDSQEQAEAERDLSASWHSISSVQMVSLIDLPTQGRRLHMDGEQFPLINVWWEEGETITTIARTPETRMCASWTANTCAQTNTSCSFSLTMRKSWAPCGPTGSAGVLSLPQTPPLPSGMCFSVAVRAVCFFHGVEEGGVVVVCCLGLLRFLSFWWPRALAGYREGFLTHVHPYRQVGP